MPVTTVKYQPRYLSRRSIGAAIAWQCLLTEDEYLPCNDASSGPRKHEEHMQTKIPLLYYIVYIRYNLYADVHVQFTS